MSGAISVTSLKFKHIECLTISFISVELKIGAAACLYATPIKSKPNKAAISLVGYVIYIGPLYPILYK